MNRSISALSLSKSLLFVAALSGALLISTVSAQQPRDLSGTYTDGKVTLVLKPDTLGDYEGTLTVNGKTYQAFVATDDGKELSGLFNVGDESFKFEANMQADGGMILRSGNATYTLRRQNGAPAPEPGPAPALPPGLGELIGGVPPGPSPGPAHGAGEIQPAPAANGPALPPFMKTGYRMYWSTGRSTTEGSSLVPDPNGFIIRNGKRYSLRGHAGRGQESLQTVTVQEATEQGILAEMRLFSIDANLQGKLISTGGVTMVSGSGVSLGDYWMNPALLARMPEGREVDGSSFVRVRYSAIGREFKAIAIFRIDGNGSASLTYDLESGLLLAGYRCDRAPDFSVQGPDGSHHFNGSVSIERFNLLGARNIEFVGANEPAPAWAVKGFTLEYRGGYRQEMLEQGPYALPPTPGFPMLMSFTIQGGTRNTMVAQAAQIKNFDRGGLNDATKGTRCFGGAMYFGALWMSPRVIQKLQPNAVLDEDKITGYRTIFAGVRGNIAVLVEQGPNESTECYFDVQSGMLVGWKNRLQMLPGTAQVTDMQLARRQ